MFAVIKTGGKQYRVTADDKITVMTLPGEAGDRVDFEVLSLFDGDTVAIGAPLVAGAAVSGRIVEHDRGPKVIAFKKRRRKNSRRKRGHRQDLTIVRITDILMDGVSRIVVPAGEPMLSVAPEPATEPTFSGEPDLAGEPAPAAL